ncbi:chloride channel protein CLC-c-like [Olea europaea var. sylvestris]|uniref:chloride channel protein CLC-c-like n=1 Tax=Olea europaea var. sylvestris TaxID=158386 RepID=UPI000C1D69BE|nr:chloride channel protein CLC-c-like [Olea europaea var. sylvestris]
MFHTYLVKQMTSVPMFICRIIENELFKQDWRSRKKVQIFQYVFLKWALALLIGLSTALVGFFNNLAVENIAGFKLLLTSNLMLADKYYQAFAAFAGLNMILAICAGVLCALIAPAAAGSGIPEVKAYLNGVDAHSILAPSTLLVKVGINLLVMLPLLVFCILLPSIHIFLAKVIEWKTVIFSECMRSYIYTM